MTITYIGEIYGPASNDKGSRSYTRLFKLSTSLKEESPYDVGSHISLPNIGALHPDDSDAFCERVSVDPTSPWRGWMVTAQYSDKRQLAEDPMGDSVQIDWGSEQFQRPAEFDRDGNAVVNSAGDPYDPPLMMDDSRRVVNVETNLAVVPAWILDYQDAVNSDLFYIDGITVAAGLAKMQSITVGPVKRRNGIIYRTVKFAIQLQRDGWAITHQDVGFRQIASGGRENIKNVGDNELPGAPVPLDGSGTAQAAPTAAAVVTMSYNAYATRAFSFLPLS